MSKPTDNPLHTYLEPARFIDSDHPDVIAYARQSTSGMSDKTEMALTLYYEVRDGFQYNPYKIDTRAESMKASALLQRNFGYCIEKATLLAAAARVVGIPSRLGFANVRNHIGTTKLEQFLGTDILVFHGFTELYLNGKWVKATPAFNKELCHRLQVPPLAFNGRDDSIFQQFTADGSRFMEYLHDYGRFADVPREMFIAEIKKYYHRALQERTPHNDWYFIFE